jgi:hypothetical protein
MKIPRRLLEQRRARTITRREMATACGVSIWQVWRELKRLGFPTGHPWGRTSDPAKVQEVLELAGRGLGLRPRCRRSFISALYLVSRVFTS